MTRQSENTRQRLLEAGISSFLEHGYHGTGLKEVLDRVQVPKGSFYNYFKSKEEFVAESIRYYGDCFAKKMGKAIAKAPDPITGLRLFFESLMAEFEAADYFGGCLVANLGGEIEGSQVSRETLAKTFRAWRDSTRDILLQGQQRGLIRSDIGAGELADLLTESWEGAVIRMKLERSTEPLRRVVNRLVDDYFRP
jgi:TetR/AcrR family transcriptional repressor of nem operon